MSGVRPLVTSILRHEKEVKIMATIKCAACKGTHTSVAEVRTCHNVGTKADRVVVVTCGWGNEAHKWETTVTEAVQNRNRCEIHR